MSAVRLFALPGAGSSAIMYYKWIPLISKNIRLSPLEIPGRGIKIKSSKALNRLELAKSLLEDLKSKINDNEEYMILGNSFSSILALDICKLIEIEGFKKPKHLFLAVEPPPTILKNRLKMSEDIKKMKFVRDVFREFFDNELVGDKDLKFMLDSFLKILYTERDIFKNLTVKEIYIKIYGDEKEINENMYKSIEFALEHIKLFIEDENIIAEEEINLNPINVDITVFGATNDEVANERELLEWRKYTNRNYELKMIVGDHLILFNNNGEVLDKINTISEQFI